MRLSIIIPCYNEINTIAKIVKKLKTIDIEEDRFGFEPEITAKIAHGNNRNYEIGISYFGRTYSEGKKMCGRTDFERFTL